MGLADAAWYVCDIPRLFSTPYNPASLQASVSWTVFLAVLVCVLALTVVWKPTLCSAPVSPGTPVLPGSYPLLGHLCVVIRNMHRLHDWLLQSTRLMGEGRTFGFTLPLLPTSYMVTDPACLEYVLKTRASNFVKGAHWCRNLSPLLGHGIFAADGEDWYWQRKLASHIFSVSSFKRYMSTVFEAKMELLSTILQAAERSGQPVDLHELMYRFTMDSFAQIAFGVDTGCLHRIDKVPFAKAFDSAQAIVNARFWLPGWPLLELLNGNWWRLRRDTAVIRSFALGIVKHRQQQRAASAVATAATTVAVAAAAAAVAAADSSSVTLGSAQAGEASRSAGVDSSSVGAAGAASGSFTAQHSTAQQDLLSLFMATSGPNGKPLATQQLVDTVINYLVAGRDTTAQALSWTFHLLMQHPHIEAKLLLEVQDIMGQQALSEAAAQAPTAAAAAGFGDACTASGASYDQLRQLRYAHAVFKEVLRLYPSVPENGKYPLQKDVLPDGTVVPAGSQVIYSPYVVNRLHCFWGPDADEFRPERWFEMHTAPTPYNYLTFNAGPRLCLGQRLAELEGVFVLARVLAGFSFKQVVPGSKVEYGVSPTMPMKQGLMVYVTRRAL